VTTSIMSFSPEVVPLVVFTCTYYTGTTDLRYQQCLETLQAASTNSIPIVVVDGSPSDDVHQGLSQTGAIVCKETAGGGKGSALREAALNAAEKVPGVTEHTLLCWQEPEKTGMIRLWKEILPQISHDSDVVVPRRDDECFKSSYPIEQYYSESYGNLYLDTVMKDAITKDPSGVMRVPASDAAIPRGTSLIDWHFGPFAFRKAHLDLWSKYKGNSYDAQLVPIVCALRRGLVISSIGVKFHLDPKMREQEEGDVGFIEKRLNQLIDLDPKVKVAWTDAPYC